MVSINNLGGTENDSFYSVIELDNYYIASGGSWSDLSGFTGGSTSAGDWDFVIAKFNKSDLSLVSLTNLGGTSADYLKSVMGADDYYIGVGYSRSDLSGFTGGSSNQGASDFLIVKFNKSDLSFVCLNSMGGANTDWFESVIESYGYYIAIGGSGSDLSELAGGDVTQGANDFLIAKFNKSDLSLVNLNNFGGLGNDAFNSLIESNGHYIAAGYSESDLSGLEGGGAGLGDSDFVVVKFGE